MKKIIITINLLAILLIVACDTHKNMVTATAPPQGPQKSVMKEPDMKSDLKPTSTNAYKKQLPVKGKMQLMEAAPSTPDTGKL